MPGREDIITTPHLSRLSVAAGLNTSTPLVATDVHLTGITVEIERTRVLERLDFSVQEGEAVGVLGANGSGKSTLLQVLATLRRPQSGDGSVLGADLRSVVPAHVRRQICLIAHQPALYAQLSLQENLRFVADLFDRPHGVADEALAQVGLARSAGRRVDRCSHGMVRRADLARALITEPTLLLLDEAHSGLDTSAEALIAHLVAEVVGRKGAAVVVSHEHERLDALVDRILRIEDGQAVPVQRRPT